MVARKAEKPLDMAQVEKLFQEMAKYSPYLPTYQEPDPNPLPPLRDPKTGALMSRFRYTDTSASVFEGC